jgi:hypothetical protein
MRLAKPNTLQVLVLGFLSLAWLSLIAILALAPEVYDQSLRLPSGNSRLAERTFLAVLSALIVLVMMGVLRRWHWTFWLLLIAFLSGMLRLPASIIQVAGWIPATGPSWYVIFQALIGVVQFAIGVVMLVEYRRYGVWGRCR